MKRSLFALALVLSLLTNGVHAQDKKVAVVTFFINKKLDVSEFGDVTVIAVNKLLTDSSFNMAPLLNDFHEIFFKSYSQEFPFQLVPEDQVINNDGYKAYVPLHEDTTGLLKSSNFIVSVNGYKTYPYGLGYKNEKNLVKILSQYDGVMDVYITFSLVKIGFGGMGVVKVMALSHIALFNKNGDKVFGLEEDAKSKSVSPMVAGVPVMTPEKILPLCESALSQLMISLQKDIPKITRKSDAKL